MTTADPGPGPDLGPEPGPLPGDPDDEELARVAALIDQGNDAFLQGEFRTAHAVFDQAVDAAAPFDQALYVRTSALVNRASAADRLGDHPAAVASYREALGLCDRLAEAVTGDAAGTRVVVVLRAGVLVNLAQALQNTGDFDAAQTSLERARALLVATPEDGAEQGAADGTEAGIEAGIGEGNDTDTAELLVGCLVALTALTIQREQWARAHELATESLDVVTRHHPTLAGRPLLNLATVHEATGRPDLAEDFARQAVAAFLASDTPAGVAEARQSLGQTYLRSGRLDEAEEVLTEAQEYVERAGMAAQSALGLDLLGLLAALRGDPVRADELYVQSIARFEESGAVVAAAEVRVRLAAVVHAEGRHEESEAHIRAALSVFAAGGLGLRCAQADFFHATLLEDRWVNGPGTSPDPALLGRAVGLAVPAALAIDAVRFTLASGQQRERWTREFAAPAMGLAFRLAARAGAADLVGELIESQCAGTPLMDRPPDASPADSRADPSLAPPLFLGPSAFFGPAAFPGPSAFPSPAADGRPDPRQPGPRQPGPADTFRLGTALASVAASAGLRVSPPPRLALHPTGPVALDPYITQAETRYGGRIRDDRVVPTW
ncbi:tetratricopeptide repeat protein [Streptomyces sp. NPDC102264]|uniref:tetratricopeptide repeat protein n=1 Tax=Streptomyces sp. NPDC102264 TaxID=3366149 RepID=UPI003805586B